MQMGLANFPGPGAIEILPHVNESRARRFPFLSSSNVQIEFSLSFSSHRSQQTIISFSFLNKHNLPLTVATAYPATVPVMHDLHTETRRLSETSRHSTFCAVPQHFPSQIPTHWPIPALPHWPFPAQLLLDWPPPRRSFLPAMPAHWLALSYHHHPSCAIPISVLCPFQFLPAISRHPSVTPYLSAPMLNPIATTSENCGKSLTTSQ
jgi:hypothetical protein